MLQRDAIRDVYSQPWDRLVRRFAIQQRSSKVENLCMIYLADDRILLSDIADDGLHNHILFPIRAIVSTALETCCSSVVIAHNHPSGEVKPSKADITQTRNLARAIVPLGIRLEDHVIVAGDAIFSFRENGLC